MIGNDVLKCPTAVQVQFRFGYVCDSEGIKVLDVTRLDQPQVVSALPLADARNIYLARTYAYVAAGKQGLVILDITNPPRPVVDQVYNADGCINDLNDVKLGITNASEFAYLADGCNGMRVVQLTSPETPGSIGFSPRPTPRLIATYPMPKGGRALAISKGVDRDRAVDESGNQLAVFGRVGARPLESGRAAADVPARRQGLAGERRSVRHGDLPADGWTAARLAPCLARKWQSQALGSHFPFRRRIPLDNLRILGPCSAKGPTSIIRSTQLT